MTSYEVRLGRSAAKAYARLDPRDRERVRQALLRLAQDAARPTRISGKRVKTIRGTDDEFHRLRVGEHRVMYDVMPDDRVVLVLGIVHRADLERWLRER